MSERPLVTGAAGFAGSHLIDLLAAEGLEVFAWRRPGAVPRHATLGATWQEVDVLDRTAVREALNDARPTAVYHCAGAAHVGRSFETTLPTFEANVRGTHNVIEGLRDVGIEARLLIPSSATVYAPDVGPLDEDHAIKPASPYALSKLAQEMVGASNPGGPSVVIARAFNHVGPRQDPSFVASGFARRIADIEAGRWEPEIAVGNLDARRDLTDVRDTVRAYRRILEHGRPGDIYNVCSGRAIAIRDLLDMLLARARVSIKVKPDPARYRPNDQPVILGNPRRVREKLGWTPEIPFDKTLDDLLEFWREAGKRLDNHPSEGADL